MKGIYFDELTDCYNRRFLPYWIDNETKRANRFSTKFGLILLDIDDFRNINNTFGHLEGDNVLIEFTQFIRKNIREVDSLVRYGGDEFIVLVPNTTTKGIIDLAHRILNNINNVEIANHKVTCSIGFAIFPDDGTTMDTLISQADNLMYQAKQQGKNRIGLKQEIVKKLLIPSPVTIGRDEESQWCLNQLQDHNTIFIGGEAGVGKTRLVLELKDRLKNSFALRGNAYAALSFVPYHPFKNMFQELMSRDFALVQHTFRRMPDVNQSELMKLLPSEQMAKVVQTEGLDKYRLFNAVKEFMLNIAEFISPNYIILLMDDLHWIDRQSCELLDFLIRSFDTNIKVFGTYRTEEIKHSQFSYFWGIWARENLYTDMTLSPLNESQSKQLLEAIMGTVPQEVVTFVYRQSGGNPFYTEEILRELDQKKKIYWNGKEWVFVKDLAVAIPSSIAETIKRKLKFLDPEIRQFLEIAAVYGQEFMPEIIAMASKRNVGQILDALDELRRLGFIKERTSDVFFFSEDVVRQIVYKSMSKSDLLQYHKLVGEAIENFYQGSLTIYLEQLANHFTIANDSQKALLYSKQAALKAKENYAHTLAIKFFDNALKYEDSIDDIFNIKYSLAEIYLLTGDYKKAIQQLNVCLEINPNAHRVYETLGSVYENMGEYNNSLKRYRQGLKITHGTDAVHTFKTAMAWVYTQLGQYLRAQKECERILKKKKHVRKRDLSDAYIILGIVYLQLGKYTKAESCLKNGLRIRKSVGDKKRVAACYLDLALNYQELFKVKASETFYKKALTLYKAIGYQHGIVVSLLDLGTLYANFNLQKAEECYLKALSIAKLIGAKRDMVYLYDNLGNINYNRLMSDQTLFNYKQALTFAKKTNFDEGIIFSSIHLSEFYREKGQLKKGKSYLKSAQRVARVINLRYYNFECLIEELHYALLAKNFKKANTLSEKLISQLRAEHNVYYKIYGFIHRARTLAALKRYAKAHTYLKKAFHFVKSLPRNWIAGEIYYVRGITYLKAHKVKEAENMFSQARDIFKTIGNLRYLDKIETHRVRS